jgi:hypothetical protein
MLSEAAAKVLGKVKAVTAVTAFEPCDLMAGSTGLEPATSGLTEQGDINEVASLQCTISIETRTCVSLRWLGRSLHLLPRAVRSSRSCHVYHWSSRARSNSRNEEGLIDLLTQPLISRSSREAIVSRAVVPEGRALRGIGQRELEEPGFAA